MFCGVRRLGGVVSGKIGPGGGELHRGEALEGFGDVGESGTAGGGALDRELHGYPVLLRLPRAITSGDPNHQPTVATDQGSRAIDQNQGQCLYRYRPGDEGDLFRGRVLTW